MAKAYITVTLRLTPEEYETIEQIARREGVTKYALLHVWVRTKIEESRKEDKKCFTDKATF